MYRLRSLTIAALICAITGCSLEDIPARGEKCPPDLTDGKQISFIVKQDNSRCQIDECTEYADSVTNGFCPPEIYSCYQNSEMDYYCMTTCPAGQVACDTKCIDPKSNEAYCGASGNCNAPKEGDNFKGVICKSDEICKEGKCIKAPCTTGEMCNDICTDLNIDPKNCGECGHQCEIGEFCESGKCKNSTTVCNDNYCSFQNTCINERDHCGPQCLDCTTTIANAAPDSTECRSSGECYVLRCADNYHIAKDNKSCIINSKEECGLPDSTKVENCLSNTFDIVDCVKGQCESKCGESSHEYEGKCEPDDEYNCGKHGNKCQYDNGEPACVQKTCQLKGCKPNYHEYNGTCELDSNDHCGHHDIHCSEAIEHGNGICENGKCKATTCDLDYHEYSGICEKDDDANCDGHGKACPKDATCKEKECLAVKCSESTNALRCLDTSMICRIPMDETNYRCISFVDSNNGCFRNDRKTPARCTYYLSEKRPGVTGNCIYDPAKADPVHSGWTPSGWTCECDSPTKSFELYCLDDKGNIDRYCCK
ncbi:MAG: hypothetical protein J6A01_00680 [Proteobacteria bacterium]|nr:hypothetical protein [Pseudomonadota bacterium]